jgi:phosphoribosyl-ATP pyrophosphohydrolase
MADPNGLMVCGRVGSTRGTEAMAKSTKKKPSATRSSKARPKKHRQPDRGFEIDFDPAKQLKARSKLQPVASASGPEVLNRLWNLIEKRRNADPDLSHSARLLARGASRIVQKLGEEAVECLIEVIAGNHSGTVAESADLLYHLLVCWVYAGIRPEEVWQELQTRERVSYSTKSAHGSLKRLLGIVNIGTTKIP